MCKFLSVARALDSLAQQWIVPGLIDSGVSNNYSLGAGGWDRVVLKKHKSLNLDLPAKSGRYFGN